jgi:hypothetical protein
VSIEKRGDVRDSGSQRVQAARVKQANKPEIDDEHPDHIGERAPLPRTDVIFIHGAACFLVTLLGAWFLGASNPERLVMVVAFGCGVWAMHLIGRLPWGEPRAQWLTPITTAYLPLYMLVEINGYNVAADVLVASYAGLGMTILVRGLRSGTWRIFGIWPK